ncbi:hypothetical protein OAO87_03835 [bacterium]|nr:hypothetical protein [bacterium]
MSHATIRPSPLGLCSSVAPGKTPPMRKSPPASSPNSSPKSSPSRRQSRRNSPVASVEPTSTLDESLDRLPVVRSSSPHRSMSAIPQGNSPVPQRSRSRRASKEEAELDDSMRRPSVRSLARLARASKEEGESSVYSVAQAQIIRRAMFGTALERPLSPSTTPSDREAENAPPPLFTPVPSLRQRLVRRAQSAVHLFWLGGARL